MTFCKSIFFANALLFVIPSAFQAAEYKCKDAAGNWSEQACPDYRARKEQEATAARKEQQRHQPPKIGMNADQVLQLDFPWGKPDHVNRSTTKRGTREQWVYGGHRYLYFDESGLLTSIQD